MDDKLKDIFADEPTTTVAIVGDKKKTSIKIIAIITAVVIVLSVCAFVGGIVVGRNTGIGGDMPLMVEVYELIKKYYYKDISWESFQEMAAAYFAGSLDAFSGIVSSGDSSVVSSSVGIQITSSIYNEKIISFVAPDMPAYSAKAVKKYDENNNPDLTFNPDVDEVRMREGDKIIAVGKKGDETPIVVESMDSTYFREVLNSFAYENEMLYIVKKYDGNGGYLEGSCAFEITKTFEAMKGAYYYPYSGDVGIIKYTQFNRDTDADFVDCIEQFVREGKKKLILDLRDNGGGELTSLQYVAQYLLNNPNNEQLPIMNLISNVGYGKEESAIITSYAENYFDEHLQDAYPLSKKIKDFDIVVLTNGNTASASEGLIGALQYYNGTQIVGTKTYGKGVAQRTFDLSNGDTLYVTNGRYFIPTKDENNLLEWTVTIHETGFTPLPENEIDDRIADYSMDKCVQRAMQIFGY
ncbi:MAG: S41 family peptidase [Clostridia bacterium]|nr:S41 family peptidase [Clostridia bacterium]